MKVVVLFVLNILAWVLYIHQPIIVYFFFVAIRYLSYWLLILLSYYYRIFPYFTWLYYLFTLFEVRKLILLRVNVFIIILIYKIIFIALNYLSNIFSSIIARIAYYVSRFIIQVMYLLLIFPINSIINKKIMRDYNILQTKIRPNNLNSGNMIDFESYF